MEFAHIFTLGFATSIEKLLSAPINGITHIIIKVCHAVGKPKTSIVFTLALTGVLKK